MPLTADGRARVTASLKKKRREVAKKIEDILAGQDVRIEVMKLPQDEDPNEPPLERLRRFMRHLQAVAARLETDEFGRCGQCGAELSEPELVETPWADRCRRCS